MNSAQKILNLILKMWYYEEFKSSFTQEEHDFVQSIRDSNLKYFRMEHEFNGRAVLSWHSSSINDDVACYVSDDGFHFSETVAYKSSTKRMKDKEEEKIPDEKMTILQEEIEDLKKTFRVYSENPQDIEVYFK
jgi:hypothetical protein